MQFRQRTQNSTADESTSAYQRHRETSVFQTGTGLDPQDQAPPSAARLAAEAAFSEPTFSLVQNGQTQISVRRARGLERAERPEEVSPARVEQPAAKEPRVFRVDSAPVQDALPAETAPQKQPVQITDTQPLPLKTRRRREHEQRTGPVVLVVQKPATQAPPSPAASSALRFNKLIAELARVTPILTAIEKAQAFQFIDNHFESQYQRLSKQADRLLEQLKSCRR